VTSVFYKDQGTGPPILLLHGFCETLQIWDDFAEELAKNFRVIRPDLPGFGRSKLPLDPFTIENIGTQLNQWACELKLVKLTVIGHSLGGYIALAMARHNPELFAGLCLFHSTPFSDSHEKRNNRNKAIDFVRKNGIEPFIETFVPNLFYRQDNEFIPFVKRLALGTQIDTFIAYSKAMRDRPSYEGLLVGFNSYLMVVAGINDSIIPKTVSISAGSLAPKSELILLENTSHMGMLENKMMCIKSISEFTLRCNNG
jgi:pimeloyl-ACP methyl ester carboxylesterase